ncbi:MAG: hypothetical protein FXF54_05235 [Kosmotoga sp.]|nr:MAG: hypothetical protein FXF54_05235 [Kosmotoga sp.]
MLKAEELLNLNRKGYIYVSTVISLVLFSLAVSMLFATTALRIRAKAHLNNCLQLSLFIKSYADNALKDETIIRSEEEISETKNNVQILKKKSVFTFQTVKIEFEVLDHIDIKQ